MRRPPYSYWLQAMAAPDYHAIPMDDPQFCRFLIRGLRQKRDQKLRYLCAHHADAQTALIEHAAAPN